MSPVTRILIMADTHNRLPAKVLNLAENVNEIWHLGDVCAPPILDELRLLGPPMTVVRGNCDSNFEWPLTIDLTRNGLRFRLQHIPPSPRQTPANCDILLHGHTHIARDETIAGVRFLNPGCITRPNRGSPPSIAFMLISPDGTIDWQPRALR